MKSCAISLSHHNARWTFKNQYGRRNSINLASPGQQQHVGIFFVVHTICTFVLNNIAERPQMPLDQCNLVNHLGVVAKACDAHGLLKLRRYVPTDFERDRAPSPMRHPFSRQQSYGPSWRWGLVPILADSTAVVVVMFGSTWIRED